MTAVRRIRKLQAVCRTFLALKRQRIATFEKVWVKVEDKELSKYFTQVSRKILQEEMERREREYFLENTQPGKKKTAGAGKPGPPTLEPQELSARTINWKTYKIPAERRRRTLSRW